MAALVRCAGAVSQWVVMRGDTTATPRHLDDHGFGTFGAESLSARCRRQTERPVQPDLAAFENDRW